MRRHRVTAIPIRQVDLVADEACKPGGDVAYDLWLANRFCGGSPELALFASVGQFQNRSTLGPLLVNRPKSHDPSIVCDELR